MSDSTVWTNQTSAVQDIWQQPSFIFSTRPVYFGLVPGEEEQKGCVGVEMLLAVARSRRISCRLQHTIPSELGAKAWTVAGSYRREALIFRRRAVPSCRNTGLGQPQKKWLIYRVDRMARSLQGQRLGNPADPRDYQHERH